MALVECVANFSEGRDLAVVDKLAAAVEGVAGVYLLDRSSDRDHHRSVLTWVGSPEAVGEAAVRAVRVAVDEIDLTKHAGVHPRLGAADVVPFVPVEEITLAECAELARRVGRRIWTEIGVPVYFYEAASSRPALTRLEDVRRGGFEGRLLALAQGEGPRPDFGAVLHPTAGAVIVGARPFLIAFNVHLDTADVTVAKQIARAIRASNGGLPHVKALGLPLAGRGQAQVSMNLTDFEQTPLHVVMEAVRREAARFGVAVTGTEIIGLVPQRALLAAAAHSLQLENYRPEVLLETQLRKAYK